MPMARRPLWVWGCTLGAVALLLYPEPISPFRDAMAATWVPAILSLVVAGWVLLGRAGQRGNGQLMLGLALAASYTSLRMADSGPWEFSAYVVRDVHGVLLGLLVLRWPRPRLQTRWETLFVRLAVVSVPLLALLEALTWDPRWMGYTGPAWWPTLLGEEQLNLWLYQI